MDGDVPVGFVYVGGELDSAGVDEDFLVVGLVWGEVAVCDEFDADDGHSWFV